MPRGFAAGHLIFVFMEYQLFIDVGQSQYG
jgi:hypothetical protein